MSANGLDVVELARELVRLNTVDGHGERQALAFLAETLEEAGFSCSFDGYDAEDADKVSLIARLCPEDDKPSMFFGGHIDTVPLGDALWRYDPLEGRIEGGRLYGRGSCDMKAGVAAFVCASLACVPRLRGRDLVLHIYGGEEFGCRGSLHAARSAALFGSPGAAVIAEPTSNHPLFGHKGVLWLAFETFGRTAHGSMPEQGDNALARMLPAACRLLDASPRASHPLMGSCTMALTSMRAGLNINSIPDKAVLTVDMRTVPGQDHAGLRDSLATLAGDGVSVKVMQDLEAVWTDPGHSWCRQARSLLASLFGVEPEIACARYFTDAAAARSLFPDLPILIMGPGDPGMAHKTDEFCALNDMRAATSVYEALIRAFYL
ncbi:MAG: M20 family metallopeptidase [Desulfovibrio sp.]|jgi:succinyl-diaminopimelate desuccinylase|nr:M20 family metallopeptidase [Desulfovibrio sp.]